MPQDDEEPRQASHAGKLNGHGISVSPRFMDRNMLGPGSPSQLVPATNPAAKALPPLESTIGTAKAERIKSSLSSLVVKDATILDVPTSPRQQLAPLPRKPGLLASMPLRGSSQPGTGLLASPHSPNASYSPNATAASPGMHTLKSPGGWASSMPRKHQAAAAAAAAAAAPGMLQALQLAPSPRGGGGAAAGVTVALPAAAASRAERTGGKEQRSSESGESDDYAYLKLIHTLRQYPSTEDFVYLTRIISGPADYNPYALKVVPFAALDPNDFHTLSVRGMTHQLDGASSDFTGLDQWEREVQLFMALRKLKLFRAYKYWKSLRVWKKAVNEAKIAAARGALQKNLFLLSPVFQPHLGRLHQLCHELSRFRLHNLTSGQVYTLSQFVEAHAVHREVAEERLARFSADTTQTVLDACGQNLEQLERQLETFRIKQVEPEASAVDGLGGGGGGGGGGGAGGKYGATGMQQRSGLQLERSGSAGPQEGASEFAYTMAAARRSEHRRLLNFIRMADYMVCDSLHTILLESVRDVLRHTLGGKLPEVKRTSHQPALEDADDGAESPEAAAAAAAAAQYEADMETPQPVFELDLLLIDETDELAFEPPPADYLDRVIAVLCSFMSSVAGLQRLYGQRELIESVLQGGKVAELEEPTPLEELLSGGEYEDLVSAVRDAMQAAITRAEHSRDAYNHFLDMVLFDKDLDLDELGTAYEQAQLADDVHAATTQPAAVGQAEAEQADAADDAASVRASAAVDSDATTGGAAGSADTAEPSQEQAPLPQVTLATFRQLLDLLADQRAQIEGLALYADVDIVRISCAPFKAAALPLPTQRLAALHVLLPALAARLFHVLMGEVQTALTKLGTRCGSVEEYVEQMQFLQALQQREKELDRRCAEVAALYALLDAYKMPVADIERAAYATMEETYARLKGLMEEVEGGREEQIAKFNGDLAADLESVQKECAGLRASVGDETTLSEDSDRDRVVSVLTGLREGTERLRAELARINRFQKLFKVPESRMPELDDTTDEVSLKLGLWQGTEELADLAAGWRDALFENLDVQGMEDSITKYNKQVARMERGLVPNALVPKFRAQVDEYRGLLPVVQALRNKNLKERHWAKIYEAVGQTFARDENFTLQVLLDAKVASCKEALTTISTEATQEAALEELLARVQSKWTDIEFNVISYKDSKDVFILGSIDEIQAALEDSLVTMSTILASRFVSGIRAEVVRVEKQLNLFSETLDEWVQVQKAWMYLEPIFSSGDIQKQLPVQAEAFTKTDKLMCDIMKKTRDRPNALQTAANATLLDTLKKCFTTLEAVQKDLEDYLERKRMEFPRFYFLSADELIEILAQTKNVQAVQPHMGKCFDGIRRLDFGDDPKSIEIYAMVSGEGERVALKGVKARGGVEGWLSQVEQAMVASLRKLAKGGLLGYSEEPRNDWVLKQPAQLVIAISQVFWCGAVEEALKGQDPGTALAQFLQTNLRQLSDLTRLVRGDLSGLARKAMAALITIDVHARDILEDLVAKRTSSTNDFDWQMQLRYYWENDDLVVRQVNARFLYAYEYLGAQARLVVTPMTDRCYLTLTGALHLKLGGAPAGPAGTGKTETTKDLGKALGVNCVVFNCGDNLDFKFMGKFFRGLAQCGAWACFDEFNRIDVEVLSVVAQQLLTIQNALRSGLPHFLFEGTNIRLVSTCGVFITMNPGYAGRTELPDNLKALFRPMAMMIPDYALVAEVMLFSEGFEDSKALSRKMVKLYKLSSEQLSLQDHYDFGMRAVKSVLVMAGALKRANPDLSEDVVLIRAMRDSNLPKFLVDDVELFQNIIGDLFPGVTVPDQDYGELELSIRSVLSTHGLQQPANFVTKIIQLYETMNVRFGVMLVGPTGGGKSECYRTLQRSLTRLRRDLNHPNDKYQVTHTYTFNPKCIKMGELYGEYNMLTNEWTDGLGSTLIRNAVTDTAPDKKWVVFDGPVDAIWIENMNTVLDDNCTLCLPNGERIKLNAVTMRMLFEVQDLAVASPATVSRCGMVYIAAEELGWRPIMQSWVSTQLPAAIPRFTPALQQYIAGLFEAHVEAGLRFVRTRGAEHIPSVDNNLVPSLASLMQSLLLPERGVRLDGRQEDVEAAVGRVFGFAYVWALGGNLTHTVRQEFDEFVRERLAPVLNFPGGGLVFDYYLDLKMSPPELRPWTEIVPSFTYNKALPYFQIIVPTVDTVRFSYLLEASLDVKRSVLYTGVTGVGKSVITLAALEGMRDRKGILPFTINFSAQTQALDTQLLMEGKLEKKRKTRYGAPHGKHIVFFIDDVNMPARERYGAQPPVELLRQFQDAKGFYDRKKLFWKDVEDTTLVAACAPPGGGRQPVTQRFIRHFTMLSIPPASDASVKTILSAILGGFLADFPSEFRSMSPAIVGCSVGLYNRISEELLPTPDKSHYTFNLRDLSKVFQGLLMASPATCPNRDSLARLWVHEASRVFHDRLVCAQDKEAFRQMVVELMGKNGLGTFTYEDLYVSRNIMFGDFLRMGADRSERQYEEVADVDKMTNLLESYLDEYNLAGHTTPMNLVFFLDAVQHIARIARILRQPRGNAMLVGVGGSGKRSLTRFAAFLGGFKCFQIELVRNYGPPEFREDLKKLYRSCGVDGEQLVFLFSDTQIVDESMVEDVNNMLNSGEVPGMFAADEKERVVNDIREWVLASGGNATKDACWAAFINRVRDNLHMVLTMSPVGDAFRARCRQFPSLINCCTIDWFNQWPEQALLSVSRKFLASTDLGGEDVSDAVARMCCSIHTSVEATSEQFYEELRRRYYTTPKSYLDLIGLYLQLLSEKREELSTAKDRLSNGLSKLQQTNSLVDGMKGDLAALQPIIASKASATAELLMRVSADGEQAEQVKATVAKEEREVKQMQQQTQAIADDAKADLEEAMPALNAAIDSLKALNKNDIVEIKSFAKPPPLVQMTMEAIAILKQEKPDWDTAKRMLGESNFMRSLEEFDKDNIPEAVIKKLKKYIDDPQYTPESVAKQSKAAMSLCMWTRAMDVYNRVAKVVEPKKAKLRGAESSLQAANAQLQQKQAALADVEARVAALRKQLADAQSEQRTLNDQAELTRKRLESAGKLTSALAEEGVRWGSTAEQIQRQTVLLVGDVFISAACIAYYGAFTGAYRQQLVASWIRMCKELRIPVSDDCSLRATLASPVEVREWNLCGLPTDEVSIDNAILATRGQRWPLMVDPQGQANHWVKAMEGKNSLRTIKPTDSTFLRTLENSIRIGNAVLLEDVGESLDPALEPILQRAVFKQGGRTLIRLGDSDVDYDKNFRLYITTKLANPHYLPEVCIKVTVINFTVTMKGLEDQLLGEVVRKERPELEEQKDRLVVSLANDKRQLKDLEDKILKLLKESQGNILDDEQLITTLNNSKLTSTVIQHRVKEAEETERNINEARESYRPAATRGSILYFVIADLAAISPMYQFSLAYFSRMFSYCIDRSEKSRDVPTRLQLLGDFVTSFIFNNVSRGLFGEHKLLFSFLMCAAIFRHPSSGEISEAEWSFVIRGPSGMSCKDITPKPSKAPTWITNTMWNGIVFVEAVMQQLKGLADAIVKNAEEWSAWADSPAPFTAPLPGDWQPRMSAFQRLCLIRLLREDALLSSCQSYVAAKLGQQFTEPEPWILDDVFPDTSAGTPIIFILSTGADPTSLLQRFAEKRGLCHGGERTLNMISLGQGQGVIAEMVIKQAVNVGSWVCLQNCHLASSWMPALEAIVEELGHEGEHVHPEFRLWLTSMPSAVFPVPILQNGVKLTNEPPKGVRANVMRTYNDMPPETLDSCAAKPLPWKRLLFSLAFLHAVLQERRKFGPLGWNIRYEFNDSDLECSSMTLRMFLAEQDAIPWQALEFVIGQINYGGRVTDDLDRRCLMSVLRQYIRPGVLDPDFVYTPSGVYRIPDHKPDEPELKTYQDYIKGLPSIESPDVFGMHPNATIAFQLQETRKLIDTIVSIQPRVSHKAAGKSPDEIVAELAKEVLEGLPPLLHRSEARPGLFERTATGQLNSLSVVLGQEMDRFNRLTDGMRHSLTELQKAIRGLVVMSSELEAMYHSMLQNQVPELWARVAYPSLKPLASWVKDYHQRVSFMRGWLTGGVPACFWLPGFFFPQGFMTGVLQLHARKHSIPIDSLNFSFTVTEHDSADQLTSAPEDGIFVSGLWIDGARWDAERRCLTDSAPGDMQAPLPVVHFKPVRDCRPEGDVYECPLYKTSLRAGVLSTTGQSTNFVLCVSLPIAPGTSSDFWVLQGVALLCMLDD